MKNENRKCQNCEYYQQRQGHQDGICHIRAPQVVTVINVKGVAPQEQDGQLFKKIHGAVNLSQNELIAHRFI
jgi:hypothetical protein